MSRVKHVLQEPRSSQQFDEWMSDFYEAVDSTKMAGTGTSSSPQPPGPTGALALAVCRGKVSEGLDFADDYGRLVIAIGIPFPAFKNPQVHHAWIPSPLSQLLIERRTSYRSLPIPGLDLSQPITLVGRAKMSNDPSRPINV